MARRAWVVNQLKSNFPKAGILLLDSGNFSDHPTPEGDRKTRGLLEGMASMGYRAVNVGERDMSRGFELFRKRTEGIDLPFISCNIVRKSDNEPIFDPYIIIDAADDKGKKFKVGVVGAVRFNPVFLKKGPGGEPITIAHPAEMIDRYVRELREEVDLVVLLAAFHKTDAKKIISEVPGIDLVIGSYGGIYSTREEKIGETLMVYSGNQGKRIGETRIFMGVGEQPDSMLTHMYHLTMKYPADEKMTQYVDKVLKEAEELAARSRSSVPVVAPSTVSR